MMCRMSLRPIAKNLGLAAVFIAGLACQGPLLRAESAVPEKDVVATGKGIEIDRQALESSLSASFADLDLERIRFEAEQKKKRHQLLENRLKEMVGQKLIEIEAASLGIDAPTLAKQVTEKAPDPTPEEVEKFYDSNKDRFKEPKEQILPRITKFLKQQKSREAFVQYVEGLAKKYDVKYLLPPLRFNVETKGSPSLGPENAPVTIVEYSDFQCPYCARVGPTLKKITEAYGDKVRLVFRNFPLTSIHKAAEVAAEASLCAADQGKFWEMHDAMFADQKALAIPQLKEKAKSLGMDEAAFTTCLDSNRFAGRIQEDVRDGMTVGVTGTPAFFVNGRPISGAVEYEEIAKIVDEELAAAGK